MAYPHGMPAHELSAEEEDRYEAMEIARAKYNVKEYPYQNDDGAWVQDTLLNVTSLDSPIGGEYVKGPAELVEGMIG